MKNWFNIGFKIRSVPRYKYTTVGTYTTYVVQWYINQIDYQNDAFNEIKL